MLEGIAIRWRLALLSAGPDAGHPLGLRGGHRPGHLLARALGLQQRARGRGRQPLRPRRARLQLQPDGPLPARPARPRTTTRRRATPRSGSCPDRRPHPRPDARARRTSASSTRSAARGSAACASRSASAAGAQRQRRDRRPSRLLVLPVVLQYARKVSDVEATDPAHPALPLSGRPGRHAPRAAGRRPARAAARCSRSRGMTTAARDIQRTRDPSKSIPQPAADDEVAELARTLQAMLDSLEAVARGDRGRPAAPAPVRGRRLARAAHAADLDPRQPRAADRRPRRRARRGRASSALRSSQRMRRLVGDLLLLARADANRQQPHEPTDISRVLVEVASELGPVSDGHHLTVDADDAVVDGARDELYRMTLNLIENAIRHTPDGHAHPRARSAATTARSCSPCRTTGRASRPSCASRIFERFVRGAGDRGSSSGLGLSIVRAVAESHGGSVVLEDADPGARFVVRLPGGRRPGARARGRLRLAARARPLHDDRPLRPPASAGAARAGVRARGPRGPDRDARAARRQRRAPRPARASHRGLARRGLGAADGPAARPPAVRGRRADHRRGLRAHRRRRRAAAASSRVVEQWRPELLVHECYEFAGPIAAERHGVRTARVALGLASTEDWVTELAAPAVRGPAPRGGPRAPARAPRRC